MLKLLGKIYGVLSGVRNGLYDRGVLRSYSLGARTISVGNITVGGTGKTPLVAHVAEVLAGAGKKVCILTRGYGRRDPRKRVLVSDGERVLVDARTGGDEPVELAMRLLGKAVVVADADRVSAARWAKQEFGITAFVLDDAFQHRRAERDLDIACLDATNPFGDNLLLPAGRLREPAEVLTRAKAIVITRSDLVDDIAPLRARIAELNVDAPVFLGRTLISGTQVDPERPAFAFCGLGNPENFFALLRRNGYGLRGTRTFPDHHYYTTAEIAELEEAARQSGAEVLLTTVKDVVKLEPDTFGIPVHSIEIRSAVDDEEKFRQLILSS